MRKEAAILAQAVLDEILTVAIALEAMDEMPVLWRLSLSDYAVVQEYMGYSDEQMINIKFYGAPVDICAGSNICISTDGAYKLGTA